MAEKVRFVLEGEELKKFVEWEEEHDKKCRYAHYAGAIGGRLTFLFIPTSIGIAVKVQCACNNIVVDLTDYESW